MSRLSRNPTVNDLTVEPTDTAVLQESAQFSLPFKGKSSGIPFSLQWMLTIPSKNDQFLVGEDVPTTGPLRLIGVSYPDFRIQSHTPNLQIPHWNTIPFFWATWTRRRIQVNNVAVKCFTPCRLQYDLAYWLGSFYDRANDNANRRNITADVDLTNKRNFEISMEGVYPMAYKIATSPIIPTDNAAGDRCLNYYAGEVDTDCHLTISQPMPIQRGMLYPDRFNVHMLVSYTGTKLNTISSPSLCIQDNTTGYIYSRFMPGADTVTAALKLLPLLEE